MTDTAAPPPPPGAPSAPPTLLAEHRFPCAQCGADYRFDPAAEALKCDHCGHIDSIATGHATGPWAQAGICELDLAEGLSADLPEAEMEQTRVSSCPSCAAQVEFDPELHARECPFCATPVVLDTGTHRHIKPRGVLPFALDEGRARDAMKTWLGSLWFAPNGLENYARKGRRMQGIYVPYWTFDARTRSAYSGERGTIHYETRTVMRDGKRQQVRVAKVRWRPASGRVTRFFDDVLVLASRALPKTYTDGLEPWDLAALEPYRPEFLAGFRAEGYQVGLEEGFAEARQIMDRTIARDVKFDIGGDRQRIHRIETELSDTTFKHVLLPVWMAAYKYRGETYRFVVNGRTGRVQGERPYSIWKIALAILGVLVLGGALVLFLTTQQ